MFANEYVDLENVKKLNSTNPRKMFPPQDSHFRVFEKIKQKHFDKMNSNIILSNKN